MSGWQGKLGGMTRAEMDAFLAGPWLARVACLKPDGAPYVVPLWYHWDGDSFFVVGRKRSQWVQHLKADDRCAICIEELPLWDNAFGLEARINDNNVRTNIDYGSTDDAARTHFSLGQALFKQLSKALGHKTI